MKKNHTSGFTKFPDEIRDRVKRFSEKWTRIIRIKKSSSLDRAFNCSKWGIYVGFVTRFWSDYGKIFDEISNSIINSFSLIRENVEICNYEVNEWVQEFQDFNNPELLGYIFEYLRQLEVVECENGEFKL